MTTIRVFCDGPSHPEGSKWWVAEYVSAYQVDRLTLTRRRARAFPLIPKGAHDPFRKRDSVWWAIDGEYGARQRQRMQEALDAAPPAVPRTRRPRPVEDERSRIMAEMDRRIAERDRVLAAWAKLPINVDRATGRWVHETSLKGTTNEVRGWGDRSVFHLECRRCRVARDVRGEKLSAILDALAARGLREVSLQSIIRVLS